MPPRYFKNDEALSSRDPHKQLIASLTRLVVQYPPAEVRAGGGIYYGPTSVAYLFLILQQFYSDLIIEGIQLGTWSAAYLKQSQDHIKSFPGPRVGKCGIADDILALLAIGAASSKDADMATELCDYAAEVLDEDSENEWLYGRAGYLYYLRLVKAAFVDDAKVSHMITDTQDDVVEAILKSPRPWKWHGKSYVGAVHGLIGIITQVTLTDPERYARAVEADLSVLLTYQYDTGNWPSSLPPGRDKLVQVCHVLQAWSTLYSQSGSTSPSFKAGSMSQFAREENASWTVVSSPKSHACVTVSRAMHLQWTTSTANTFLPTRRAMK
jgi:hypothetical protein